MVRTERVSVVYPNGVTALRDVSVNIQAGEFVFIVGASGTGKSTFLKLLYREAVPTRGRVFVEGRDISALPPREIPLLRRRIGVIFQDFRLLPNRTVYENVAFALHVTGMPRKGVRERTLETLEWLGLLGKSHCYPAQLSGGEQQRVSIARALVHQPVLLLADEPTGNLDPYTSWEIIQLLNEIAQEGTTVIVATHDHLMVSRLRKRVLAFEKGRLVNDIPEGSYFDAVSL